MGPLGLGQLFAIAVSAIISILLLASVFYAVLWLIRLGQLMCFKRNKKQQQRKQALLGARPSEVLPVAAEVEQQHQLHHQQHQQ